MSDSNDAVQSVAELAVHSAGKYIEQNHGSLHAHIKHTLERFHVDDVAAVYDLVDKAYITLTWSF